MNDKMKTTLTKNDREIHTLAHNRFDTYMVSIFNELDEAQFYKLLHRGSPHRVIKNVISFKYLKTFKSNENKKFRLEIEDRNFIYVGENFVSFEIGW